MQSEARLADVVVMAAEDGQEAVILILLMTYFCGDAKVPASLGLYAGCDLAQVSGADVLPDFFSSHSINTDNLTARGRKQADRGKCWCVREA